MSRDEEILRRIADRADAELEPFEWIAWHTAIPYPPRLYPLTEISRNHLSRRGRQDGGGSPSRGRTPGRER